MAAGSGKSEAALLAEFCRNSEAEAALMRQMAGHSHYAQVDVISHRLRGCAVMFGAMRLAGTCVDISAASKSGKESSVQVCLDALDRERATVASWIAGHCRTAVQRPASSKLAVDAQVCAGLSFLVVEDHEFQREIIMRLIRRMGARDVMGVADGERALVELSNPAHARDIMILDLSMPGMDGTELLQIVGKSANAIAVILSSAQNAERMHLPLEAARSCGLAVLGAVPKPLTAANLSPMVTAYRATRRPRASAWSSPRTAHDLQQSPDPGSCRTTSSSILPYQ